MSTYTPFPSASSRDADENEWWPNRELSLIQNLLEDKGELDKDTIGETLGCKYWGPLRFRNALKEGVKPKRVPEDRPQPLRARVDPIR
jgi:hypothetical protein